MNDPITATLQFEYTMYKGWTRWKNEETGQLLDFFPGQTTALFKGSSYGRIHCTYKTRYRGVSRGAEVLETYKLED